MVKQFIGVKAIILKGNKILLIKRSDRYRKDGFTGAWDIPGGRIDFGEEPIDGLVREVKEETGLNITRVIKPLDARTVYNDGENHIVRITYLCNAGKNGIKLSDEHTEAKWMGMSDLGIEFKDKELKAVIEKLKEEFKNL